MNQEQRDLQLEQKEQEITTELKAAVRRAVRRFAAETGSTIDQAAEIVWDIVKDMDMHP